MEINTLYKYELSPKEIFISMRENLYDFPPNLTSIDTKYLNTRTKLIQLLRKISSKMYFKSQTYFLSIYYLDILFTDNKFKKIDLNYNIIALVCLLLAAKFCENDPIVPELKYFTKIYNKQIGKKNVISVSDLFYYEVMIIKLLNHKLNYYTIYDFNYFFFQNNILTEEQIKNIDSNYNINNNYLINNNITNNKISSKLKKVYEKIYRLSRIYSDIFLENYLCIKYSSLLLSVVILKKSIELILLNEKYYLNNYIDPITKERFLINTNKHFYRIMKGYYKFDYEKIPEYKKLLNEYDILKIFEININQLSNCCIIKPPKTFISLKKMMNDNQIKKDNQINYNYNKNENIKVIKKNEKIYNFNSIDNFSGQNILFVSDFYIMENQESKYINKKNFGRNLGINNCINDHYFKKEKKNINLFLKNLLYKNINRNRPEKTNSNFSFQNKKYSDNKLDKIIKRTRSKDVKDYKNANININNKEIIIDDNNEGEIGKLTLNANKIVNNNNIQIEDTKKPYYKKIIQNFRSKLKNKNLKKDTTKISNSLNFENIKLRKTNKEKKHNCLTLESHKFNRKFLSKYNNNTEIKLMNNINKKFNFKDINILNINNNFKEKTSYSNNKEKEKKKLLNLTLFPQLVNHYSPLNTLNENKRTNIGIFSLTNYIKKMNFQKKIHQNKISKSINNYNANEDKRGVHNYIKINKRYGVFAEQQKENKNKNYLKNSSDIDLKNYFSNKNNNSSKALEFKLIKSKKEKEKLLNNKNKIHVIKNGNSGEENPNKINAGIDLNKYINTKKIKVNKNTFDNELKYRFKKNKNCETFYYNGFKLKNMKNNIYRKTSTIVINNNIRINFGNKSKIGYKNSKSNYGQNSISYLLDKIPIYYQTEVN